MSIFYTVFDFLVHINVYLDVLVAYAGGWVYGILFIIIFCETGLVVTPFLPGDSLLFAAGAIASRGRLHIGLLIAVLFAASVLGDTLNYAIGKFFGEKLARRPSLIKQEYLERTHRFFKRYGAKTIILCRFVPIIRTVAPFVAGAGAMTYRKFMLANIIGAALWVCSVTLAGYFFANLPFVKNNFTLALFAVVILSILPALIEAARERRKAGTPTL